MYYVFSYLKNRSRVSARDDNGGFTLIEVMVGAGLMVVVGAGVLGLQIVLTRSQISAFNSYTAAEQANLILTMFGRELRSARESEAGSYPMVSLEDNEIVFYTDYDLDGVVERVRYAQSGNQFLKGVTEPTGTPPDYQDLDEVERVLSENMGDTGQPVFYYFNGDWPVDTGSNPLLLTNRLADTRLVRINLTMEIETDLDDELFVVESYVQPRDIKSNL